MSALNLPPVNVPTLTEVVDWSHRVVRAAPDTAACRDENVPDLSDEVPAQQCGSAALDESAALSAVVTTAEEAALAQRILARIELEMGRMLEERLPLMMATVLDRAVEELVARARKELSGTLRDVVAQVVVDEIASGSRSAASTPD